LKRRGSKAACRIIAMKKVGKQTQLDNVWQDFFVKSELAVTTCSKLLLFIEKYEEMLTSRNQLLNTLGRGHARAIR
jgi:hypothetical protein